MVAEYLNNRNSSTGAINRSGRRTSTSADLNDKPSNPSNPSENPAPGWAYELGSDNAKVRGKLLNTPSGPGSEGSYRPGGVMSYIGLGGSGLPNASKP